MPATPATAIPGLTVPAPLWCRGLAAIYDGLLLAGLSMVTLLLVCLPLNGLFDLPPGNALNRVLLLSVTLGFFAGFWVRGGQTLGMRAWRLQVRRIDGSGLRLPVALVRALATVLWWGLALTPLVARGIDRLPELAARLPNLTTVAVLAGIVALLGLLAARLDGRRRLPQDWLAGCEVVRLPANPHPAEKRGGGRD